MEEVERESIEHIATLHRLFLLFRLVFLCSGTFLLDSYSRKAADRREKKGHRNKAKWMRMMLNQLFDGARVLRKANNLLHSIELERKNKGKWNSFLLLFLFLFIRCCHRRLHRRHRRRSHRHPPLWCANENQLKTICTFFLSVTMYSRSKQIAFYVHIL